MIEEANKLKKEYNLNNCEFILGDITKLNIDKKFDTVTCIGNTFAHITTYDFVEILKAIEKLTENTTKFIIEYRDFIYIYHNNMIKKLGMEVYEDKVIFDKLEDYNDQEGKIEKIAINIYQSGKIESLEFFHAIWAPFILRTIMKIFNWKLIYFERYKDYRDIVLEVYEKAKE